MNPHDEFEERAVSEFERVEAQKLARWLEGEPESPDPESVAVMRLLELTGEGPENSLAPFRHRKELIAAARRGGLPRSEGLRWAASLAAAVLISAALFGRFAAKPPAPSPAVLLAKEQAARQACADVTRGSQWHELISEARYREQIAAFETRRSDRFGSARVDQVVNESRKALVSERNPS